MFINGESLMVKYQIIESEVKIIDHISHVTYDSPVNFNESMKSPRHRWFPYKEGFSPGFVEGFLRQHCSKPNSNIIDPFTGVGTTLIEGAKLGHNLVGFEVTHHTKS